MKQMLLHALGVVAAALLALTAGPAAAQVTTANGPYYATPSWDQTLPASTRFIVLSNMNSDAVLDRETGVVWQRSPLGTNNWLGASGKCLASTTGNRAGWRLPTVNELARLFDPTVTTGVPLPSGHPFTGLPSPFFNPIFWTVNPAGGFVSSHRVAGYQFNGLTGTTDLTLVAIASDTTASVYVWCVTGGLFGGEL